MRRSIRIIFLILGVLVGVYAVYKIMVGQHGDFKPTTEAHVYERNLLDKNDGGEPQHDATSDKGVSINDLFDEDNTRRYGYDGTQPDGVGLEVTLRVKRGKTLVSEEKFNIPRWETFEEGHNNPARVALVEAKKTEFEKLAAQFLAAKEMAYTFAVVVDTTEGVGSALRSRVNDTLTDALGTQYGKAEVKLYTLYEMAYQGGRQRVKPKSAEDLKSKLESFLGGDDKPRANSSVVRGLASVLTDVKHGLREDDTIEVHIWTDGLENTEEISVYKDPTLLAEQGGWPRLDAGWNPTTLKFSGLDIHIHPLPPKNHHYEEQMEKGLEYLNRRLTDTGAKVTIEAI